MRGESVWWTILGAVLLALALGIFFFMPLVRFSDLDFLPGRPIPLEQIITLSYLSELCTYSFEEIETPECQVVLFASFVCILLAIAGFILLVRGFNWAR